MNTFRLKVAGHVIEASTIHIRPFALCRDFITEEEPELLVSISKKELERDKKAYEKKYQLEDSWEGEIEVYSLLQKVSDCLLDYDIFLMHGAAVADKYGAYLFLGKSGTGKTTHTKLWLKNLPEAYIVNGDKPFIISGNTPLVCGSPWAGKERIYTNACVPLKAVIFMNRSDNNTMHELHFSDAFPMLLQQVYWPQNEEKLRKTMRLLSGLQNKIKFFKFDFNNFEENAFSVAYDALHQ